MFTLLIGVLLLGSCSGEGNTKNETKGFQVKGKLANSAGEMIKLDRIGGGNTLTIDSVKLDDAGKFELTGETDMPDIFVLRNGNGQFAYLLAEPGEEIEIQGDASNFALNFKVSGSKGSEMLSQINEKHYKVLMKMDSMSQIYKANEKSPQIDQILKDLTKQSEGVYESHRQFLREFIKKNTSSLASILALYQPIGQGRFLSPDRDWDMYELADSVLNAAHPMSVHVKNFHADMTAMRQQRNQPQEEAGTPGTPDIGSMAPDISLPSPTGEVYSLSSLKGKYVLLDFWAAWCRPCRMENPVVKKAFDKFNKKGFEVFQVSLDKTKEAWTQAISMDQLYWKYHVSDLKYWESAPARLYGVQSIPASFLIDPQGKIIAKNLRGPELEAKLAELLK